MTALGHMLYGLEVTTFMTVIGSLILYELRRP
jgi:hypothetical protein